MRKHFLGLLLLCSAPPLLAQDYGYQDPQGPVYHRADRNTVVGPDGRVYVRRGNTLVPVDPRYRGPWVDLPPGSRVVGHIADSVMIETADGKRQTCTPVGGQTICH